MKRNIVWKQLPILAVFLFSGLFFTPVQAQTTVGNETQLFAALNAGQAWIQLTQDITTSGIIITNNNTLLDGNGFALIHDNALAPKWQTWFNTDIINIQANGVELRDLEIKDAISPFATYGGSGITLTNIGRGTLTITRCDIHDNENSGVLNGFGIAFAGVTIVDSDLYHNGSARFTDGSGLKLNSITDLNISNSRIYENRGIGIFYQSSVIGSIVDNCDVYGNGMPVTGNTLPNNGSGISIDASGGNPSCSGITISNSRVYGNNIHGVECRAKTSDANIFLNEIYSNGVAPATGNQGAGVVFQFGESTDNTVAENDIHDNADPGIYMYKLAGNGDHSGNIFYKNTLTNNGGGIVVLSSTGSFTSENTVTATVSSNAFLPGGGNGIYFGGGSDDAVVYNNIVTTTTAPGAGILISDKGTSGVDVGSNDVYILGNHVGVDLSGSLSANGGVGIRVERSDRAFIGDATSAPTISRNVTGYAVITIDYTDKPNSNRNIISGNVGSGIEVEEGDGTHIDGNYIGTNLTALGVIANGGDGINLSASTGTLIGTIERNIISGNIGDGIEVS